MYVSPLLSTTWDFPVSSILDHSYFNLYGTLNVLASVFAFLLITAVVSRGGLDCAADVPKHRI
jgi:hypothetical protein